MRKDPWNSVYRLAAGRDRRKDPIPRLEVTLGVWINTREETARYLLNSLIPDDDIPDSDIHRAVRDRAQPSEAGDILDQSQIPGVTQDQIKRIIGDLKPRKAPAG